jgi:hypothetical protein
LYFANDLCLIIPGGIASVYHESGACPAGQLLTIMKDNSGFFVAYEFIQAMVYDYIQDKVMT